jgi:hypothetical protein
MMLKTLQPRFAGLEVDVPEGAAVLFCFRSKSLCIFGMDQMRQDQVWRLLRPANSSSRNAGKGVYVDEGTCVCMY